MTDANDHILAWLRDAHATEKQAETMLSSMSDRLEHYPDLKTRIDQHVEETRHHAELIEGCLERLGHTPSTLKDMGTKLMGFGQALSGAFTDDEIAKGVLAGYTFEHMEIASYKMLIAAANQMGDIQTAQICTEILRDEEAMANWLEANLDSITMRFLELEQAESV